MAGPRAHARLGLQGPAHRQGSIGSSWRQEPGECVQTTTPQFVLLCQWLIQAIEEVPEERRPEAREAILDSLMKRLMREGLVFDRGFAGHLLDQLQADPDAATSGGLNTARLEELKERVKQQDYFSEAVLQTMGERLLWVLGPS